MPTNPGKQPPRYLLFLADTIEYEYAKTAHGLRDWAGDRCVGEMAMPAATVTTNTTRSEERIHAVLEGVLEWINKHRPTYGHTGHQNDTLVALAIVYASKRFKRPVADIVRDIMRNRSAKVLFPATQ